MPSNGIILAQRHAEHVRTPPRSATARALGLPSAIWLVRQRCRHLDRVFANAADATEIPAGRYRRRLSELGIAGGTPRDRHGWKSRRHNVSNTPNAAPHSRMRLVQIASNTGFRSPGDALITCNTSAVAVCCSSASRCSVISRAFSIAITAWAAKFSSSAICLSENGRTSGRRRADQADRVPSLRSATAEHVRAPDSRPARSSHALIRSIPSHDVGDMNNFHRPRGV